MEKCLSCGMPMRTPGEHGGGDPASDWCVNCCHEDGSHKTREEVLEGWSQWLLSGGCEAAGMPKAADVDEARRRAAEGMAKNPAWQE